MQLPNNISVSIVALSHIHYSIYSESNMVKKSFVLSIKPVYASKIFDGSKTIELRRKFPHKDVKGAIALIYSSSPEQKILGFVSIKEVKKLSISDIWNNFSNRIGIEEDAFDKYFNGLNDGYAIFLDKPTKLRKEIGIEELSKAYNFSPPQSYIYATDELLTLASNG